MDFNRKLPIRTSGLNAQLLNHQTSQRHSLPLSRGIVDGVDHAPAYQALPSPIYRITPSEKAKPPNTARANFFTDLFAARKGNNE